MNSDELRELCADFRYRDRDPDDELIDCIETDVREYRARFHTDPAPAQPPDGLLQLLPLMGWLIYEASWKAIRGVKSSFESMSKKDAAPSREAYRWIRRTADAARQLPWPEFAPRALGAIRAQALAESKRDTVNGYDAAYIAHREGADKYLSFRDTHGTHPGRDRYLLDLDDVLLQLALGETGTACRTAERVLCRWSGEPADAERWIQRLYRDLSDGIEIGGRALATARRIEEVHGLVHEVTEHRLALVTCYRNPGIMTARAALLSLALSPAMEHLGRKPSRMSSWKEERADVIERFRVAYRALEKPVRDAGGELVPMVLDHRRALVQLRLNFALLVPGASLPGSEPFAGCPERDPLDAEAVAELSRWLADEPTHGGVMHGNSIGALTMPLAIRSVMTLRALTGDGYDYLRWRHDWSQLGRFAAEPGRAQHIGAVLRATAEAPSLNISTE